MRLPQYSLDVRSPCQRTGGSAVRLAVAAALVAAVLPACKEGTWQPWSPAPGPTSRPTTRPAGSVQTPAPIGLPTPEDPGWPRQIERDDLMLILHAPQVDSWRGEQVRLRLALTAREGTEDDPAWGVVRLSGRMGLDATRRVVTVWDVKDIDVAIEPGTPGRASLAEAVAAAVDRPMHVALDRLLVDADTLPLLGVDQIRPAQSSPRIVHVRKPTALVRLDGEPVFAPLAGMKLRHVVNTFEHVLHDPKAKRYFVLAGDGWVTGEDLLRGPWVAGYSVPPEIKRIPPGHPRYGARQFGSRPRPAGSAPVAAIVSGDPVSVLVTPDGGEPKPVSRTPWLHFSAAGAHVFLHRTSQRYYYLAAGRWFAATLLDGPWQRVAEGDLPADLGRLSADRFADVLASVHGTVQARRAVRTALLPRLAALRTDRVTLRVRYHGSPAFAPIEGTDLTYATNTHFDVLRVGRRYYCCHQGVWFVATAPTGPWTVVDKPPDAVGRLRPECPLYHVRFVAARFTRPDVLVAAYTAGYLGTYVENGAVVYGTGRPYAGRVVEGTYFGYPRTYSACVRYQPWAGGFAFDASAYRPYHHAAVRADWHPAVGWAGQTYRPNDPYAGWPVRARADRPWWDLPRVPQPEKIRVGDRTIEVRPPVMLPEPEVRMRVVRGPHDLYATPAGELWRRVDGAWQVRQARRWVPVDATTISPHATTLRRDLQAVQLARQAREEAHAALAEFAAWRRARAAPAR